MSNFSEFLINLLYNLLSGQFEETFMKVILPNNEDKMKSRTFKEFILEILEENFSDKRSKEDLQEFRNNIVRNITRTKKSWHTSLLKEVENPKNIKESNQTILKELRGYERMTTDELERAFGVKNLDMLLQKRIEESDEWRSSKNSLLCEFRYYRDKKPNQIFSAFKYDINFAIINIIYNHFNGNLDNFFAQRATELIDNPIFGINRMLLKFDTLIDQKSKAPILFNDYHVSDDYILRTLIREPEKVQNIKCYVLDERDSEIIDLIYSKINPNFYADKSIVIDISEVVKKIYPYNNGYCYEDAEDRIMRIGLYQVQGLIKEKGNIKDTKFIINFFDNVKIESDPVTGKRYATIVFGDILYNLYFKKETVKISAYQYKQIENTLSKILFFSLQKERVQLSLFKNKDSNFYIKEFNYLYFKNKVRFRSKRKSENIKLIAESLEEFKSKKILIKEYSKTNDGFVIEFYPLLPEEKVVYGINKEDVLQIESEIESENELIIIEN